MRHLNTRAFACSSKGNPLMMDSASFPVKQHRSHSANFAWKYLGNSSSTKNRTDVEKHNAEHSSIPQGAVIFIKMMKPHLGSTHALQMHEMCILVVRLIMDPPQLVDLIDQAIHIPVITLRIEQLNKFGPCAPFAVPPPDIGATSPPMAPSGTARARSSIFRLPPAGSSLPIPQPPWQPPASPSDFGWPVPSQG